MVGQIASIEEDWGQMQNSLQAGTAASRIGSLWGGRFPR